MVDFILRDPTLFGKAPEEDDSDGGTLGDIGLAVGGGAAGIAKSAMSGARGISEAMGADPQLSEAFKDFSEGFGGLQDDANAAISPRARKLADATIFSPDFWEHPVFGAALKTAQMTPSLAAGMAAGLAGGEVWGPALASVAMGAMTADDAVDDVYSQVDKMDDKTLQAKNSYYAGLRSVMDERQARADLSKQLMGFKPLIVGAVGGIGGLIGPVGTAVRGGVAGGAEKGLVGRTLTGAGEGAAGMGALSGASNYASQDTATQLGNQKEIDGESLVKSVLDGSFWGAAIGGATGAVFKHGKPGEEVTDVGNKPPAPDIQDTQPGPQAGGSTVAAPPPDGMGGGGNPPQPTATDLRGNPGNAGRPNKVEIVDSLGPSDEELAAAQANDTSNTTPNTTPNTPPTAPTEPQEAPVPDQAAQGLPSPGPAPTGSLAPPGGTKTPRVRVQDTGKTVPEPAQTFAEQIKQLQDGQRSTVLIPKGTKTRPMVPDGMKQFSLKDGMFIYDPTKIQPKEIIRAAQQGRLNEILGLGPVSKDDAASRIISSGGAEKPVAVTERTPDGTEVKAAAGTDQTAPAQVQALESSKTPGNNVQVEDPKDVLNARKQAVAQEEDARAAQGAPRSKMDESEAARPETVAGVPDTEEATSDNVESPSDRVNSQSEPASQELSGGVTQPGELPEQVTPEKVKSRPQDLRTGKHRSAADMRELENVNKLFRDNPPPQATKVPKRSDMLNRLEHIEAQAKELGIKNRRRASDKGTPDSITWLQEARQMLSELRSKTPTLRRMQEFQAREWLLHNGEGDAAREARRVEGDIKSRKGTGVQENQSVKGGEEAHEPEITGEHMAQTTGETEDEQVGRRRGESVQDEALSHATSTEGGSGEGEDTPHSVAAHAELHQDAPDEDEELDRREAEGHDTYNERLQLADKRAKAKAKTVDTSDAVQAPKSSAGQGKVQVETKSKGKRIKISYRSDKDGGQAFVNLRPGDVVATLPLDSGIGYGSDDNIGAPRFPIFAKNAHQGMLGEVYRMLADRVGKTNVHYLTHEAMVRLGEESNEWGKDFTPGGFFDTESGDIYVDNSLPEKEVARVTAHEGVHAMFVNKMEESSHLRGIVNALMEHVLENAPHLEAEYGFTNEHEFVAEAFSQPKFQQELAKIDAPEWLRKPLEAAGDNSRFTVWRSLIHATRKFVLTLRRLFGTKGADQMSALEAVIRVGEGIDAGRIKQPPSGRTNTQGEPKTLHASFSNASKDMGEWAKDLVEKAKDKVTDAGNSRSNLRAFGNKFLTNDHFRQSNEKFFGGKDLVRAVTETIERLGAFKNKLMAPAQDFERELLNGKLKYPAQFADFAKLQNEARIFDIDPSKPLPKQVTLQGGEKYGDMRSRFEALPTQLQDLFRRQLQGYADAHTAHAKALIDTFTKGGKFSQGVDVDALKTRLHNGTTTDADKEELGKAFTPAKAKALASALELRKTRGPYVPLARRGDFVVQAEHKIATPVDNSPDAANGLAKRLKGSKEDPEGKTFQFYDEGSAKDFVRGLDAYASARKTVLDPNTGKVLKGDEAKTAEASGKADIRWRVRVQTKHVEFHDTETSARKSREALETNPKFHSVQREQRRSQNPGINSQLISPQVRTLIKSIEQNGALSSGAKQAAINSIREASISMQRGNRAMKNQIHAQKVSGASEDVIRNYDEYMGSNAAARANLKYHGDIEQGMGSLIDYHKGHQDDKTIARSDAIRELENRIYSTYTPSSKNAYTNAMNRVMTYSFMTRMMSPAHLLLHMTHPWMISAPVLAARHGVRAIKELTNAYRDMGGVGQGLKAGVTHMGNMLKDPTTNPYDFVEHYKEQLSKAKDGADLGRMVDELVSTNVIHPESGMEVHRSDPGRGAWGRTVDRIDGAFRQLTQATESINRFAEAVAAYRLERGKGATHEKAVQYAKDTLANTQGLYSETNQAPIFRSKYIKPFLQFKQFPQMIYHLLARNLYNAFKGETKEARWEATKAFAGVVGTHAAMAGVLGLPMEAIKAPLMLSNALGVTDTKWSDIEDSAMEWAAKEFGPKGGEVLMHGLSRLPGPFSVDVHHRLGLNSLLFFGEPEPGNMDDTKRWLFDMLGGAPASLAADFLDGTHQILNGHFDKALEKMLPSKAFADVIKAVQYTREGKPTGRGAPGMTPYSLPEALMKAAGFTPGREAQYQAGRAAAYDKTKNLQKTQQEMVDGWVNADPANKLQAFKEIQAYNKTVPKGEQITQAQLTRAAKTRDTAGHGGTIYGIKPNKRNSDILTKVRNTYGG